MFHWVMDPSDQSTITLIVDINHTEWKVTQRIDGSGILITSAGRPYLGAAIGSPQFID